MLIVVIPFNDELINSTMRKRIKDRVTKADLLILFATVNDWGNQTFYTLCLYAMYADSD